MKWLVLKRHDNEMIWKSLVHGTWKALDLKVGTINVCMHGKQYLAAWLCLVCVSA